MDQEQMRDSDEADATGEVNQFMWCCQGAEECDGIRWNADDQQCEFVLYLNPKTIVWHKAVACPLCGTAIPLFRKAPA